jgi:hypothetical protein
MIDGFEMVAERFAADRDAMLDDFRRLSQREGVSLDRVGRIGQFNVKIFLKLRQGSRRQRAQPIKLRFLLRDVADERFEHGRDSILSIKAHLRVFMVSLRS